MQLMALRLTHILNMLSNLMWPKHGQKTLIYQCIYKKIVDFGKGYALPSSKMIRTNLLKRSKEREIIILIKIKESWKEKRYTILSNSW